MGLKMDRIRMDITDITFCFHISVRIQIRIQIVSAMSDRIRLGIDIINIRFEYSDMDTVLDVEYLDSDTDRFEPL